MVSKTNRAYPKLSESSPPNQCFRNSIPRPFPTLFPDKATGVADSPRKELIFVGDSRKNSTGPFSCARPFHLGVVSDLFSVRGRRRPYWPLYCAILRDYLSATPLACYGVFWCLNMANWLRYPPPQKRYLSDACAIPHENKANFVIPHENNAKFFFDAIPPSAILSQNQRRKIHPKTPPKIKKFI